MLERLWFVGIAKRGSKKSEPVPFSHRFSVVAMYSTNSVLLHVFVETLSDAVAVLLKEPRFLLMRANYCRCAQLSWRGVQFHEKRECAVRP